MIPPKIRYKREDNDGCPVWYIFMNEAWVEVDKQKSLYLENEWEKIKSPIIHTNNFWKHYEAE